MSKSKRYCSVPQCNTYGGNDISLHFFPIKRPSICKQWAHVLKIGKPVTHCMTVCSKHFHNEDFQLVTEETKRRRLKPTAVPSRNLPLGSHDKKTPKSRPTKGRSSIVELPKEVYTEMDVDHMDVPEELNNSSIQSASTYTLHPTFETNIDVRNEERMNVHPEVTTTPKLFINKAVQTDESSMFTLTKLLSSDEKLKAFTGVDHTMLEAIKQCCENIICYNNKKITDIVMKIMLVLVKLKLNIPFGCLSILFNISTSSASRYFYSVLSLLSVSLKPGIYWPSKGEIMSNMPKCFERYRYTRIVLDGTEIAVDKCRCLQWITPSGLISYVSAGYGGCTSDRAIFIKENVAQKLDPNDGVMVDKGFLIEKECEENLLRLIRPPFLRKNKQFSKVDAEETANIARARVHVERAIERLKSYAILRDQISWYLLPYIDDIMIVGAVLVNLAPPILADNKFE